MTPLKSISKIIYSTCLLLLLSSANTFAAEEKYENFNWESPNGWKGAIFDVPTWFAEDMLYNGREIIRFHDGFYDKNSTGFWTYAFALLVVQTKLPTTEELIDETRRYFTGLARVLGDSKQADYPVDKIIVTPKSNWIITNDGKKQSQLFELQIYDSFTTGKSVKLNARITTWLCSGKRRAIHYSLSPQELTHPLWEQLDKEVDALKCW